MSLKSYIEKQYEILKKKVTKFYFKIYIHYPPLSSH